MTQIFSYSLVIYIPLGLLLCVLYPFNRLRLLCTIGCVSISLYYIYKETREYVVKYLEGADEVTLWYMKAFVTISVSVWAAILRYYVMEP